MHNTTQFHNLRSYSYHRHFILLAVFLIMSVAPALTQGQGLNLLSNGNFEQGSGDMPLAWTTESWEPGSMFRWELGQGLNGSRAVSITSTTANDARWLSENLVIIPGAYYTLRGFLKGENIVGSDSTGANLCVMDTWLNESADEAGNALFGSFDWQDVVLVFRAPASETVHIGCRLGFHGSTVTGKLYCDNLSLTAGVTEPYALHAGQHVELILETRDTDVITPEHLQRWIGHLDAAYEAYHTLVGGVPFEGDPIAIQSVRSDPGGWAVAGNPIFWHQWYVRDELCRVNDRDDWSFGILHELGHDFDIEDLWNWDAEFWANFKMFYVVETLNARVCLGTTEYIGAGLETYYRTDAEESYIHTIAKGIFGGDGLTYCFIRMKQAIAIHTGQDGWRPFQQTFRYYLASGVEPATELDNFNLFLDKLTEYAAYNVRSTFLPGELQTITAYLGNTTPSSYLLWTK